MKRAIFAVFLISAMAILFVGPVFSQENKNSLPPTTITGVPSTPDEIMAAQKRNYVQFPILNGKYGQIWLTPKGEAKITARNIKGLIAGDVIEVDNDGTSACSIDFDKFTSVYLKTDSAIEFIDTTPTKMKIRLLKGDMLFVSKKSSGTELVQDGWATQGLAGTFTFSVTRDSSEMSVVEGTTSFKIEKLGSVYAIDAGNTAIITKDGIGEIDPTGVSPLRFWDDTMANLNPTLPKPEEAVEPSTAFSLGAILLIVVAAIIVGLLVYIACRTINKRPKVEIEKVDEPKPRTEDIVASEIEEITTDETIIK